MAIALVQSATQVNAANSITSGPSITLSGVTAGNAIVAFAAIWRNDTTSTLNSVTDGGNSYTLRQALATNGVSDRSRAAVAYAVNVSGGSLTIVFNMSSSVATYFVLGALEFSGVLTASPEDAQSTNPNIDCSSGGGSIDVTAGAITTTDAADLIVGCATVSASSAAMAFGSPASWTNAYRQNDSSTFIGMDAGYWLPGAIQTAYNPAWSHANPAAPAPGGGVVVALKASALVPATWRYRYGPDQERMNTNLRR